jgi:hypothetical protein
MDENLETKDENMKNEMTHSSIVQLLEILKLCNAWPHGIVAKILGESIIPIGQI